MAGGMHAVVLGSDLGAAFKGRRFDGGTSSEDLLGKLEKGPETVEIVALSDEKSQEAAEILRERHQANKIISGYTRTCNSTGFSGKESKLPKQPGDERTPLTRLVLRYVPIFTWAPTLTCVSVRSDVIAGLTVGVMVIPQSMSYAAIAGLEYIYGMYSAFVPTLIYACFGMSRQLAVGPVAMVSLLIEAGLQGQLTEEECPEWYEQGGEDSSLTQAYVCPQKYAQLAFLAAALVGAMQLVGSALNLGALVNLLGHPVTSGFTSGAAIIIGLSQAKDFLGYDIPKSQQVYITIADLYKGLPKLNGMTLCLGLVWFAYLFINKMVSKQYKRLSMMGALGPLISCVAGILLMWLCPPLRDDFHVKYIGKIPSGLPPFSIGDWNWSHTGKVLPTALTSCLIGYMESIAIGKNLATKHGYEIAAGQEMFALGLSNLVGAAFSCYPVTGSFSRSAVANATGATSQLAGVITSIVMLCTLLFLTPLFFYLPKFALAAVVVNSVIPLIAIDEARRLYRIKRHDFLLWVVAFLGTLFLGVLLGIAVAVGLSLIIVIYESVRPQITILWRIPGSSPPIYRGIKQESRGSFIPNVFIARIGSSMYFANVSYIKDMLLQYVLDLEEVNPIKYIVLEMTPVTSIDSSAVHIIEDIFHDLANRDIQLAFAMVGNRVDKTMKKAHLKQYIGEEWFFPTVHEAVQFCLKKEHLRRKRAMVEVQDSSGELDVSMIDIHTSNEVGFSNDLQKDSTVIFITLVKDVPMIMSEITAVLKKNQITIYKAQIEPLAEDGAKHTYWVRAQKTQQKLIEYEIERLREELNALIQRHTAGAPNSNGQHCQPLSPLHNGSDETSRVLALEQRIADQADKIDRLLAGVQQHNTPKAGKCAPLAATTACTIS